MVEAVDRTVSLIEHLARNPEGIGVASLAKRVGLAPSTTHRYLTALQQHGLVEQGVGKNYLLTSRLYLLGLSAAAGLDLEAQARGSLRSLTDLTQETSCLMVRDGHHAVCIAQVDSYHQLKIAARVGSRQDLRLGATSRVLLAYAPQPDQEVILQQPPASKRTERTVTDPESIKDVLEGIRELGYYVSKGEVDEGVMAIAAPIRDRTKEVIAAIALAAPQTRLGLSNVLEEAIELVLGVANELSLKLGYADGNESGVTRAA